MRKNLLTPTLYRVILPVPDVKKAARFYEAVLGIKGERVSDGRYYLNCRGTILALYDPVAEGDPKDKGWRFHTNQFIYFSVSNLQVIYRRIIKAKGRVLGPIATMPWGEKMFWARDPFGAPISFVLESTVFRTWKK